jgi:cytochrome c peroxidase
MPKANRRRRLNSKTKSSRSRAVPTLTPQDCANIRQGEGVFTAQSADNDAGDLTANGATGGPTYLYPLMSNFYLCLNDPFGCGGKFDPAIFNVYAAWAKLTGTDPQTQARLALYRGEQVFNTVPFNITGVAGLNDVQGKTSIAGTCGTCHNNPNVGNHTSNVPMNIGVTGAGLNAVAGSKNLDISGLPVFTVLCTGGPLNLKGKIFQATDLGVAMISGQCADIGKTKVPIIRGIAGRSPYFHNGAAPEITNLIDFYDQRFSIGLTDQQKADLAVFLESL